MGIDGAQGDRAQARRVAIGGISMGGYGALLLGAAGNFCAVGGHSPALWFAGRERGWRIRRCRGLRPPRHRKSPVALLLAGVDRRRDGGSVPQRGRLLRARDPREDPRLAGLPPPPPLPPPSPPPPPPPLPPPTPPIERKVLGHVRVPVVVVVTARPDVDLGVNLVRVVEARRGTDPPCRAIETGAE